MHTEKADHPSVVAIEIRDLKARLHKLELVNQLLSESCATQKPMTFSVPFKEPCNAKASEVVINIKEDVVQGSTIDRLTEKYGSALTVHGLNHIYTSMKFERLFWIATVAAALGVLFYGLHSLTTRYMDFEVSQSYTIHHPLSMKFPSFTICSSKALDEYKKCFAGVHIYENTTCLNSTNLPSLHVISCKRASQAARYFFPFLEDKKCTGTSVEKRLQGACVTVNSDHEESQQFAGFYDRVSYVFEYYDHDDPFKIKSPSIKVIPHYANQLPLISLKIGLDIALNFSQQGYHIEVSSVTKYKRLPPPYKADGLSCLPAESMSSIMARPDKFPCLKSCSIYKQLEKCGAINDLWKYSVPVADLHKFQTETLKTKAATCLFEQHLFDNEYDFNPCPKCPALCKRVDYKAALRALDDPERDSSYILHMFDLMSFNINKHRFYVDFWYRDIEYHIVSESPKYPWFSFVAEFGGFLGLLTGCSAISIIEVFLVVILLVLQKLYTCCTMR